MEIPEIFHQIWFGGKVPRKFKMLSATWKKLHPDWKYILWSKQDCRNFVDQKFPHILEIYDGYQKDIQRIDAVRYLILSKIGGVYIDMDFECYENIEGLIGENVCVLAKEPNEHCVLNKKELLICNAFIAAVPDHTFIKCLINELSNDIRPCDYDANTYVMESTGPYMVTRVYEKYPSKKDVNLLEPETIYPLTRDEIRSMLFGENIGNNLQDKLDNSYAVHYWLNSWVEH